MATTIREVRAIVAAADRYPGAQRRILPLYLESVLDVPPRIDVMPAYELLLAGATNLVITRPEGLARS